MNSPTKHQPNNFGAFVGIASGLWASSMATETPHKYGIGLITGFVICYVATKVLNFIDKRTD